MKKYISLLTTFALSLLIASMAQASVVYTGYTPGSWSDFTVGAITKTSVNAPLIDGLSGTGQGLFTFTNLDGERRLLLVEQSTTVSDKGYFYDITKPEWNQKPVANIDLCINNYHGAAQIDEFLFLAGYGSAGSGTVVRLSTTNDEYKVLQTLDMSLFASSGYNVHPETIVAYNNNIYVVASIEKNYSYKKNILVKLPPSLKTEDIKKDDVIELLSKNRDGLNTFIHQNDTLYISTGFYQNDAETVKVEKINLADMTSEPVIVNTLDDLGSEINALLLAEDGSVYVTTSASKWETSENVYKLYKTTLDKLSQTSEENLVYSVSCHDYVQPNMAYDKETGLVWVCCGKLIAYDGQKVVKEYEQDALKNNPSVLVAVENLGETDPVPPSDSSGGCSAGFSALALLALIPMRFIRKRH